jgi:valyl-tRNA synthetase
MSKSLGTGIDPLDLINGGPRPPVFTEGGEFPAYGADAVRWGLLAMSSGQDVRFSEERIAQGQQLGNKLWNAARLVLLGTREEVRAAPIPTAVEDRWMLSRLARAQAEVTRQLDAFDFSQAALALYDFVYGELCDWYLELVKPRLRASEPELIATLLHVLTETISLAHPIIPFETEEIWSLIPGSEGLLAQRVVPALSGAEPDRKRGGAAADEAEAAVERTIAAIQALRRWRDGAEIKAGAVLPARLAAPGYEQTAEHLARLARLSLNGDARVVGSGAQTPVAAVPIPGGVVEILGGAGLDREAAIAKLRARIAEVDTELARARGKLANQGFVAKAPPHVVQGERDKLEEQTGERERLAAELRALGENAEK